MTVDTFRQTTDLAPVAPTAAVDSIVRWAQNLSTAAQAIRLIVDTPFMPASFWPLPKGLSIREWPTPHLQHPRESVEEFTARREVAISSGAIAVVKGDEVGLTPQAALESIYVVRGKPGMYAETMEALVRAHGHQVVVEQLDDRVCRMRSRRRGEEDWQRFEFSMARADKAGYSRQNPKYRDDPQTMLHARCRAITARGTAPEVLKGLHSVEEIEDELGSERPAPATRTVKPPAARAAIPAAPAQQPSAQPQPAPLPAPAVPATGDDLLGYDQPDQPPAPPAETGEQITDPQLRKLGAIFGDLGVTGTGSRERRLLVASRLAGRELTSSKDLTKTEATAVIDQLTAMTPEDIAAIERGDTAPAPAEPQQDDLLGDADFGSDENLPDPTVEPGWGEQQ